jgi:hypothetical protein
MLLACDLLCFSGEEVDGREELAGSFAVESERAVEEEGFRGGDKEEAEEGDWALLLLLLWLEDCNKEKIVAF